MDDVRSQNEEKPKRRRSAKSICREAGDHVHYPPMRLTKSKRPHHAPSPTLYNGIESILQVTRKPPHYGECKKNQAAEIGTIAYDGCGEFVTANTGEDSLNCAACGCHRSFHLEESVSESRTVDGVPETVLELLNISSDQFRKIFYSPYGGGGDRIAVDRSGEDDLAEEEEKAGRVKKVKTTFTAEQKEKMRNYAEKLTWTVSAESIEEVDKFCEEIGVTRKNFKVWMRNHKVKDSDNI